jgi:formylglycine-generating enzyme required for sulfatase activity
LAPLLLSAKKETKCPNDMVLVDSSFCMDKYEWPNKKGVKPLITASGLPHPKDKKNPMDATRLCKSVGKRVCKAPEWIDACKGPKKTKYTWGNKDPKLYVKGKKVKQPCNYDKMYRTVDEMKVYLRDKKELKRLDQREPSGYRKECTSHYGAMDMNGNVEEWVEHPTKKGRMCLAGGHWSRLKACSSLLCGHDARWYYYSTGFRCCKDV